MTNCGLVKWLSPKQNEITAAKEDRTREMTVWLTQIATLTHMNYIYLVCSTENMILNHEELWNSLLYLATKETLIYAKHKIYVKIN